MAPRKPTHVPPQPANLSALEMRRGIARLEKRIGDLGAFEPQQVPERFHPSVKALEVSIAQTLDGVFGHDSIERLRFGPAARLDTGPVSMGSSFGRGYERDFRPYLVEGKAKALALLNQATSWLSEELEGQAEVEEPTEFSSEDGTASLAPEVFIVHGRNAGPKEAVARFLEKLDLKPIILHEQANSGRTVIEKIEAFGNVGFAVVLLTPDDFGGLAGEDPKPRPRQNVVMELGYFLGKLGRGKVCTLALGEMDLPSDWRGVIDEPYDDLGRWKFTLARELKAAGYPVDLNRALE